MDKKAMDRHNFTQFLLPISAGMIPYNIAPELLRQVILHSSVPFELLRRSATGASLLPVRIDLLLLVSLASTIGTLGAGALALSWGERRILAKGI